MKHPGAPRERPRSLHLHSRIIPERPGSAPGASPSAPGASRSDAGASSSAPEASRSAPGAPLEPAFALPDHLLAPTYDVDHVFNEVYGAPPRTGLPRGGQYSLLAQWTISKTELSFESGVHFGLRSPSGVDHVLYEVYGAPPRTGLPRGSNMEAKRRPMEANGMPRRGQCRPNRCQ